MHQPVNKELEGKVIACLKSKFKESKLTIKCEHQMESILREAALNYHLNPLISALCADEVNKMKLLVLNNIILRKCLIFLSIKKNLFLSIDRQVVQSR